MIVIVGRRHLWSIHNPFRSIPVSSWSLPLDGIARRALATPPPPIDRWTPRPASAAPTSCRYAPPASGRSAPSPPHCPVSLLSFTRALSLCAGADCALGGGGGVRRRLDPRFGRLSGLRGMILGVGFSGFELCFGWDQGFHCEEFHPRFFFFKKIGVRWRGFRLEEPVVIGFVCLFRLVKSLGLHFVLVV